MGKILLTGVIAALALSTFCANAAEQYPSRQVVVINPFAAGGGSSVVARIVAQKISENTGKSFVVEDHGGAGGQIGTALAIKAKPDGYTILCIDKTFIMMRSLYGDSLPWGADHNPLPITTTARFPFVIVVNPKLKITSLGELIQLAKANPGKLNFGSSGIGGVNHIVTELFMREANIKLEHIPYKSMGETMMGILSGAVDVLILSPAAGAPYIKNKTVIPIAIAATSRWAALPDVPTTVEAGLPSFVADNWFGFAVPKGTPKEIVDWLYKETGKALSSAQVKKGLAAQGVEPGGIAPERFAAVIQKDTQQMADVIKAAGIKVQGH